MAEHFELDPTILALRQRLHEYPEISEQERATSLTIRQALADFGADKILHSLGSMGTGVCGVYEGQNQGPTIVLRCELDALPILESNRFPHRSRHEGISHKCGHDGHMATLLAVARSLNQRRPIRGKAILLFQPAEEIGTGAKAIVSDDQFKALAPDYVFGFHNVPKFPLGEVLIRNSCFASASTGFIVELKGRTSHSSYPEYGISPTDAVIDLISHIRSLADLNPTPFSDKVLATLSHVEIGRCEHGPNFGTTPGQATVMGVLRCFDDQDLALLKSGLREKMQEVLPRHGLEGHVSWREEFPATMNDESAVTCLEQLALKRQWPHQTLREPFRWSEDFGYFTQHYKGALFGLGAGENQPQLHNDNYDYPDELIPIGASIYRAILDEFLDQ